MMAARIPAVTIRLVVRDQGPGVEDCSAILLKIEAPYNSVKGLKVVFSIRGGLFHVKEQGPAGWLIKRESLPLLVHR